ncbi:hypothetical protein GBA52_026286 [Prunus armeniaca]|nr:hypothetical protein GBA52_026286 [Prunus armeniaca]
MERTFSCFINFCLPITSLTALGKMGQKYLRLMLWKNLHCWMWNFLIWTAPFTKLCHYAARDQFSELQEEEGVP